MEKRPHYHASALAAGMPFGSGVFPREEAALSFLLSLFSRLPQGNQRRLRRPLRRRRFALLSPAYILLVEECSDERCLRGKGNGRPS
jgi:hypothetical protein